MKKPAATRKKEGSYRADRHGSPALPVTIPDMPEDLSESAQDCWKEVAKQCKYAGVIATIDGTALRMLSESYAQYIEANRLIQRDGLVLVETTQHGTRHKMNPAVAVRNAAWKQVYDCLRQFGMTPSSRTGLGETSVNDDNTETVAQILKIG